MSDVPITTYLVAVKTNHGNEIFRFSLKEDRDAYIADLEQLKTTDSPDIEWALSEVPADDPHA